MGGTVLDMFTLGATPFSLSLYSFPRGGGDTILAPSSYLPPPLSPSSFSFPLSLLPSFFSFFLFFFLISTSLVKSGTQILAALDDRPIMLTEEAAARNF